MKHQILSGLRAVVIGLVTVSTYHEPRSSEHADFAPVALDRSLWQEAIPRADPLSSRGNRSPYYVNGHAYNVLTSAHDYRKQGIASWYGMKFHERPTANGEVFDVFAATAAHRSLPIPTYIRVTNLGNDRSVLLRVNDRGPFHPDRLVDLSYGAALQLGFAEEGTAMVLVESVDMKGADERLDLGAATYRYLQLGAYSSVDTAGHLRNEIVNRWAYPVSVSAVDLEGRRLHRVRVGPFPGLKALEDARTALMEAGYPSPQRLP